MEKANKLTKMMRAIIMTLIVVITLTLGQLHQMSKMFLSIDAFCPFGGLESLFSVFTYGMFLQRIAWGSLIMLGVTIIVSLFFRRSFCGYICPLGSVQEFFGALGRKAFKKRVVVPKKLDGYLRYLKYIVLVVVLVLTYLTGRLIIRPYDPWAAMNHLNSVELFTKFFWGFVVLMVSLIGSFFVERFFCKYLCPMGAFLAILSKIGIYCIKRDEEVCIDCGICDKKCPVNIEVSKLPQVKSAECISCNLCVLNCPEKGALKISTKKGKKGISAVAVISIVLVMFILIFAFTTTIGMFRVSKIPRGFPIKAYGLYLGTDHITQNNSLAEVCYVYGVSADYLIYHYGLTEQQLFLPMKEIGFDYNEIKMLIDTAPENSSCSDDECD